MGTKQETKRSAFSIIGAGDAGEMAVRWILMNPHFGYRPVGFLDEDPFNAGREIHGVGILGGFDQLETLLGEKEYRWCRADRRRAYFSRFNRENYQCLPCPRKLGKDLEIRV